MSRCDPNPGNDRFLPKAKDAIVRRLWYVLVFCGAILVSPTQTASAQEGGATSQQQPDLYAFWVHAGAFRGSLGSNSTYGLRLAANLGEETFFQVGVQTQDGGLTIPTRREAVNVALGRSLLKEEFTVTGYAGPMVASSDEDDFGIGALGAVRADVHLFWGVGVGAELQASWAAGYLSGNGGLYLTFGGFER